MSNNGSDRRINSAKELVYQDLKLDLFIVAQVLINSTLDCIL